MRVTIHIRGRGRGEEDWVEAAFDKYKTPWLIQKFACATAQMLQAYPIARWWRRMPRTYQIACWSRRLRSTFQTPSPVAGGDLYLNDDGAFAGGRASG